MAFGAGVSLRCFFKGVGMGLLILGGVLFGMILGRFFRWFVLVPVCGLASVLVLANHMDGFLGRLLQIAVVTVSLQVGYLVGLAARNSSPAPKRPKDLDVRSVGETPSSGARTRESGK